MRMSGRFGVVLFTVLVVGTASTGIADEKDIQSVISAPDLSRYDKAVLAAFKSLSSDQLSDLKGHKHDTIAIAAAWHEVRHSLANRGKPEEKRSTDEGIDRIDLERFLGFVEGRLRTRLPKVWQESFRHMQAYSPRNIRISSFEHWPRQSSHFWPPPGVTATRNGNRITVSTKSGKCTLPKSVGPEGLDGALAVAFDNDFCVCAFYNEVGYGYKLHCIDRKTEIVVWRASINAAFYGTFSGTGFQSRVSIVLKNDRVFVYGACLEGAYVEVFSLGTGRPICRFTSATQW